MRLQLEQSLICTLPKAHLSAWPESLLVHGQALTRKSEIHLTLLNQTTIARLATLGLEPETIDTIFKRHLGAIKGTGRFMLLRRDDRQGEEFSLIEWLFAPWLIAAFSEVSERCGEQVTVPPAHVTWMTSPGGSGIGLSHPALVDRYGVAVVACASLRGVKLRNCSACGAGRVLSQEP